MAKQKRERPTPEEAGQAVGGNTNKVPKGNLDQIYESVKMMKGGME